jgi:hypothetical protein
MTVACPSCTPATGQEQAVEKAKEYFAEFSVSNPANDKEWGLSQFRVFGRLTLSEILPGGSMRGVEVPRLPGDVEQYEVTFPFWCSGSGSGGETIKLRRILVVTLAKDAQGSFAVAGHRFIDEGPLTFWRQLTACLAWCVCYPVVLGGLVGVCLYKELGGVAVDMVGVGAVCLGVCAIGILRLCLGGCDW